MCGSVPPSEETTHKSDRNDGRRPAHLARSGFFKPVQVKSLSAHAVRSLIIARKKLVGQRVTWKIRCRGLAVVFGVRLPRALTAATDEFLLAATAQNLRKLAKLIPLPAPIFAT
jgi:transposase